MPELWELSVEEIAAKVRGREASAAEVLESCLARTAEVEPLIGAYLEIFEEEARARAAGIDRRIAAGEDPGPLAGVPVALKDNLSLDGRALTCGSRILAGYVAPYTATAVERLLAAGAVPFGRANMDEFAMGSSCENSAYQLTRNPWDLARVPGGSSGGPVAAVAAGSVPLALGSETGGSVRQPAALCGVVGVKPTYGRVSRYGLVAFASSLDQIGPIARNVRDAALGLQVIAGEDPRDATSAAEPVGDYLARIEEGIAGLKIGILREIDVARLGGDIDRNWRQSLDRLTALGADLVEVSVPSVEAAIAIYYVIATSEASANLARFDGVRYGRRAPEADNLTDLYFDSRGEGFGAEVKRRIMLGTFALSSGYYEAYYGRARGVLERMRHELDAAFGKADLLVTPTTPSAAFRLGEKVDDPLAMYLSDIFTTPANLTGVTATAVPSGADSDGLPLSLQILGPRFGEAGVFRAARAFERAVGWTVAPTFRGAEVA
ncbi:MAG TPA: Asp-tRNA(Asn)/Glu-tRNA(Gln) amidotransferase subunit GatA [Thermoanaerobaculia bacterium]|jgi:aspartyl-tRNA(Asn)/glutamyl-tRNA(Gln) amidotransferase subunit A|nr:Asp-tRNA(Asn)/Glu-tRNA(Gln) amidotransferase subunit GatA [Thermoanaerobaculia bacterium]